MTQDGVRAEQIDTNSPHPARIHDHLLGGKDRCEVDREAADRLLSDSGVTGIELADIRHPQGIVDHPGVPRVIDFDEPVARFLVAVPHFPTDAGGPARSSRHCATPCPPATARSVP